MNSFKRNIPVLSISQALMQSSMSLILTIAALVGYSLTDNKAFATLPIALIFIAVMLTSIPASLLMERIGRKRGFMLSTLFGVTGGIVASMAIIQHNFWLFAISGLLFGIFNGFGNYFRFAAADAVEENLKSKAISFVMTGGIVASFIGPNLAYVTRDVFHKYPYLGDYIAIIGLYLLILVTLGFLKLPNISRNTGSIQQKPPRQLKIIVQQPKFIVALISAMLGYGVMSFIMTATPLAMQATHSFSDTTFVIQWHVFGMFAPSLITGYLISRIGVYIIMLIGALFGIACICINILGSSVTHYWSALTLLGISWNFLYIGGTTLLTETYSQAERGKTQALNDFAIFSTVTFSSLTAGTLQHFLGWKWVNLGALPFLIIIVTSILWLIRREHSCRSSTTPSIENISQQ